MIPYPCHLGGRSATLPEYDDYLATKDLGKILFQQEQQGPCLALSPALAVSSHSGYTSLLSSPPGTLRRDGEEVFPALDSSSFRFIGKQNVTARGVGAFCIPSLFFKVESEKGGLCM